MLPPSSITATVKFEVPPVVGVPLITPVPELIDKPGGSDPELMEKLRPEPLPPLAVMV